MNETLFDNNSRISVKQAFGKKERFMPRGGGGRGYMGGDRRDSGTRGPQPSDICHNCQGTGHWATHCKEEKKPPIKYSYIILIYIIFIQY